MNILYLPTFLFSHSPGRTIVFRFSSARFVRVPRCYPLCSICWPISSSLLSVHPTPEPTPYAPAPAGSLGAGRGGRLCIRIAYWSLLDFADVVVRAQSHPRYRNISRNVTSVVM